MVKQNIRKLLDDLAIVTFRDVVGWEGLYGVTTCGKIWSYRKGKWLSPYISNQGYPIVDLYSNYFRKKYLVHRLLAIAYIPTEDITLTVNHINSCRLNAYLNNLEWATYGENLKHAYQKGAKHSTTKHKAAVSLVGKSRRKTVVQIDIITGKIIAEYVSITEAAKHVGICISNISECCRGKRETAGGYKWKYKNEGEMSICLENFLC